MVETDPGPKKPHNCDVKGDNQLNGPGSKNIDLGVVPSLKTVKSDPEKGSNSEKADFERAIELTGYGRFHYLLLAVCGLVSTSEEMDVISMSFILPSAQCDLDLSTQTKGWLNSIIFIGMMVGAYAWGSVADSLGRKRVLIAISVINGLAIVCSSFSQNYELFMLFRFINGAALGGSGPVIWSYFAEFQPKKKRGAMLSFMAAFWTLGNLFVAGLAWVIIPSEIGGVTGGFVYNSWRIFLLVMSLPSFLVAALLLLLPESPKFLITTGRQEEAMEVFRTIYLMNTGRSKDEYPVKQILIEEPVHRKPEKAPVENKEPKSKMRRMMSDIVEHSKQLFVPPILKFTAISITINFTFHIGYYGLMMWFPEMFNRFDEWSRTHDNAEADICQVTAYVTQHGTHSAEHVCDAHIHSDVFMDSLITVSAAIPSNILTVLGMDRLGRKFFLVFATFSAGLCSAAMYFVYNKTNNLIVSAIFSSVISCGNASLDCLITEVFPTNLRATGVAISMVAARLGGIIGNVVIAVLLDTYCPAPTFIVAVLLASGGLMCLFLPNTTRQALQ
ncbi:synaptic vesicle glycoprotein 2B-like [Plodia interpunctella]|uniref:synaptic vesicle glycoprotein 2B-like n=1 Tax=Plodia interpunctella TaxID=58824 RepID=UPI002368F0D3|nr:synaptic vesicle glycoprotein 2B-like [Plodia interpunctella]XP_053612064.1 synaptic vesicle glycoprotein 2B-like [Plodia interpunctella]XP_053612065.1 synaptic vesicle glycoprotein 2B-like [Plodia interpunctella]